jgi:type IV secretion system protein VirB10
MNLFPFRQDRDDKGDAEADNVIDGERHAAMVDRGLRMQSKATNLVIVASVVTLAGVALWRYYAAVYERHKEASEPVRESVSTVAASLPPLKPPIYPEAKQESSLPPLAPSGGPSGSPAGATGPSSVSTGTATSTQPMTPAQQRTKHRLESPLFFTAAGEAAASPAGAPGITPPGGDTPARFATPARGAGARAYMLANPSMMITQGTKIPCNVVEALDTTLPGLVTCLQAEDVRSADGKVVLLERGTKWVGQQANGVAQGQRRVGIVWSRGETPNHVLVDVDSGGADWLGRPGIAGDVDSHFWDRFGAAILLSVISDVGPYLTASRQGGGSNNTTIAFPNIGGGAQQVMSDVLKSTLNIQPTLTAPQGSQVVIHVARDLDFRDVYALRERPASAK